MRRKHEPIAQDPQPDLSARFEGLSLPELITRAVLEFPDGVGMADSKGRIQFANASMERMLGYDRGELIGVPISRLHPSGTDNPAPRPTMESLQAGGWSGERDLLTKQGSVVPTLETVKPLRDEAGKLVGYLCTVRDIRERRAKEQALETTLAQLRATQKQLIQSEKLAAVGTLISGVAHEINNPLGNILGRVQLLQRAAGDDESKRDLQTVRDECGRAIRIVRNLLSFTREHMPETTLVSLNDVIDQVLELRAYELKVSNIELKKNFGADLPQIHADPHQLQQVFLNLVINAEQAMTAAHGRGSLSITTKRVGDTLQVVVADDGPGIPDELISQIFNPFFTTKDVGAGTGLGLSVCYGIVKEHGGQMRVESEQEKGTTFTVELPCRCKADGGGRLRLDHAQQIREEWE